MSGATTIINELDARAEARDFPQFRVGDTVRVHVRIVEGEQTRVQVFEGPVIRRRLGGVRATFTVRKIASGVGVERTFPVYRPRIATVGIDRRGHRGWVAGGPVVRTARELALLTVLCGRRGRVVTRGQAIVRAWGDDYLGTERTVDIHVRRLRQKLGDALPLVTVRGVGDKVEAPAGRAGQGRGG